MKIISWNVNSIRKREGLVLQLLQEFQPDIVCLQEIKAQEDTFIGKSVNSAGYYYVMQGQKSYNGVAILAKMPIVSVQTQLIGFEHTDARFIKCTWKNIDEHNRDLVVYNVYVPNGQIVGSAAYYKQLAFFDCLINDVCNEQRIRLLNANDVNDKDVENTKEMRNVKDEIVDNIREMNDVSIDILPIIVVAGDFNVALYDTDAHRSLHGFSICSQTVRKRWKSLLDLDLMDKLQQKTWWDYRYDTAVSAKIDNILVNHSDFSITVLNKYRFDMGLSSDHAPLLAIWN